MGIFGNIFGRGSSGGMMNIIRCDEPEYLVWKWRPLGQAVNTTSRENAIRYGSTLSVKDGEAAVFLYRAPGGGAGGQDFIMGPYQDTIKTANFPILARLVGTAFGGDSPFQAEVYFINLQGNNQIKFSIPYFDVTDPRNMDLPVPVAVHGSITFNITDYQGFIKLNRLVNFDLEQFKKQIKDALIKYVKGVVCNIPSQNGIPLVKLESNILQVSDIIQQYLSSRFVNDFGVNLKGIDISDILIDKETEAYRALKSITQDISVRQTKQQADIAFRTNEVQADLNIRNMRDTQRINTENMEETLRIQRRQMDAAQSMMLQEKQRAMKAETENNSMAQQAMIEETQRAMRAQTEGMAAAWQAQTEEAQRSGRMRTQTAYPQANILDKQTQMMGGATQILGQAGTGINMGNGGPNMNPGGMMAGMAVGGALGQQMAGMMGQMGQQMQQQMQTPPPMPQVSYFVAVNGQQYGPYDMAALQQMVQAGQFNAQSMVWCQGMTAWAPASSRPDLAQLLMPQPPQGMPPIPGGGMPPMPPTL